MGKKFTVADAEKAIMRNYDRLYRKAAVGQNMRMFRAWYEYDRLFTDEELSKLLDKIHRLEVENYGTPEPAHVRGMTKEEALVLLHADLWAAERRLLLNPIPKPAKPVNGRLARIMARNYDVAFVSMMYELFPDEPRKLTAGDLMIEDYDAAITEAAASEPVPDVSP